MISCASVGDIVAVVDLTYRVIQTLRESTGSSAEYQELISELDSLSCALNGLHQVVTARGPNSCRLEPSSWNAINFALVRCQMLMNHFLESIKQYQKCLRKGGSGNRARDSWRKIGWGIIKKHEVEELKSKLTEQKATINMMISLSNCAALARVEQSSHHQHVSLATIYQCIQQLPYKLGFSWEGTEDNRVWLIDVMGITVPLPMELCMTWELFDGILKLYFRNRAGCRYVERGDYELAGEKDNQLIHPTTWESQVKPGVSMQMSVVLRLRGNENKRKCPSCKELCFEVANGETITCLYCQASFRVSTSFTEDGDAKVIQNSAPGQVTQNGAPGQENKDSDVADEVRFLRWFHVIFTSSPRRKSSACAFCRMGRLRCNLDTLDDSMHPPPTCSNCKEYGLNCFNEFQPAMLSGRRRRLQQAETIYRIPSTQSWMVPSEIRHRSHTLTGQHP